MVLVTAPELIVIHNPELGNRPLVFFQPSALSKLLNPLSNKLVSTPRDTMPFPLSRTRYFHIPLMKLTQFNHLFIA
jgi:hypothetical protein